MLILAIIAIIALGLLFFSFNQIFNTLKEEKEFRDRLSNGSYAALHLTDSQPIEVILTSQTKAYIRISIKGIPMFMWVLKSNLYPNSLSL